MEKQKQVKYNALSSKELAEVLQDLQKEFLELSRSKLLGKLSRPSDLFLVRRNIARVKTFMTLKETLTG